MRSKESTIPTTISAIAFVIGLLLVIAALVGQSIKVKEVDLPAIHGIKRIVIGLFGAALMLLGINDGKLWPSNASGLNPSLAQPSPQTLLSGARPSSVKVGDPHPLPNGARLRLASIKVKYGCVVLLSHPVNEDDQFRVCQNMPTVPPEWQTKTVRIGADCSTHAGNGVLTYIFANPNFEDRTWEYWFAC